MSVSPAILHHSSNDTNIPPLTSPASSLSSSIALENVSGTPLVIGSIDDSSAYYCAYHQNYTNQSESDIIINEKADEYRRREKKWEKVLQGNDKAGREQTSGDAELDYCNVIRSDETEEHADSKRRSMGFLASFLSCGVIIGFNELVNHEGDRKVTDHLLTMLKFGAKFPQAMLYDTACSLKRFWNKQYQSINLKETEYSKVLLNLRLAVDRFHRKGHVHPMCHTSTNPDCVFNGNSEIYQNINSSIAEQSFSYLSQFKLSLRGLAYPNSTFFSLMLLHLWNCRRVCISPDSRGVGKNAVFKEKIMPIYETYCVFETAEHNKRMVPNDFSQVQNMDTNNRTEPGEEVDYDSMNFDCNILLENISPLDYLGCEE
ncbi:unnamed protein product [Sphagnum troendelagicum]